MLNMKSRDDDVAAELARLKDDIRRVQAGAVVGRNQVGGAVPSSGLRGLRIRIRTFLDQHRLTLPRPTALELRRMLQELDQAIAVRPDGRPEGRIANIGRR